MMLRRMIAAIGLVISMSGCRGCTYTTYECEPEWEGLINGSYRKNQSKCDLEGEKDQSSGAIPMKGKLKCVEGDYHVSLSLEPGGPFVSSDPGVEVSYKSDGSDEACALPLEQSGIRRWGLGGNDQAYLSLVSVGVIPSDASGCGVKRGASIELALQATCHVKIEEHEY